MYSKGFIGSLNNSFLEGYYSYNSNITDYQVASYYGVTGYTNLVKASKNPTFNPSSVNNIDSSYLNLRKHQFWDSSTGLWYPKVGLIPDPWYPGATSYDAISNAITYVNTGPPPSFTLQAYAISETIYVLDNELNVIDIKGWRSDTIISRNRTLILYTGIGSLSNKYDLKTKTLSVSWQILQDTFLPVKALIHETFVYVGQPIKRVEFSYMNEY